jgi:hypothetical protein
MENIEDMEYIDIKNEEIECFGFCFKCGIQINFYGDYETFTITDPYFDKHKADLVLCSDCFDTIKWRKEEK